MQVSVESPSNLKRAISVTVPAAEIDEKVEKKLKDLTKTIKMDGFRPGKVPFKVVKQRYGSAARYEILDDVIQKSLHEALNQEKLNPASPPTIDDLKADSGQPLQYKATFEIFPEIKLANFAEFDIEKKVVTIEEKDVQQALEEIRKQHPQWETVEHAAKEGDQLTIDFVGKMDDELFEGGSANDITLTLGAKGFIPGFEEGLLNSKAGDERKLALTFPKDYSAKNLAGKAAEFEVTVKKVCEAKLADLDDEFAKTMGIKEGGLTKLKEEMQKHMQHELDQVVHTQMKEQLLTKLLEAHEFEVPQTLIDQEVKNLQPTHKRSEHTPAENQEPDPEVITEAKRRVRTGLLLAELMRHHNVKVDEAKVRDYISKAAQGHQEMISWYYNDKKRLEGVNAMILEQQVIDKVLKEVKIIEKTVSYAEVMGMGKDSDI